MPCPGMVIPAGVTQQSYTYTFVLQATHVNHSFNATRNHNLRCSCCIYDTTHLSCTPRYGCSIPHTTGMIYVL